MRGPVLGTILCLVALWSGPGTGFSLAATDAVVQSVGNQVVLTVDFDPPRVESLTLEDGAYHRVSFEGCEPVQETGHPQVPVRGFLVGIPFGVHPRVRVLEVETGGTLGDVRIPPAPRYEPVRDDQEIASLMPIRQPDVTVYGRGAPYPEHWAALGWEGTLRFQRVVQVAVFPFRWNPALRGGTWARRVTVEVSWEDIPEKGTLAPAPLEPRMEGMYGRLLVNEPGARGWRRSPAPPRAFKMPPERDEEFKLTVPETGIYAVQYDDLVGMGGPIAVDELGLYQKVYVDTAAVPWVEVPVPIHLVDEDGDGLFGFGDRFYFWGLDFQDAYVKAGWEDRYTRNNVYWVGRGAAGGARMDTIGTWQADVDDTLRTFPDILRFEDDIHYDPSPTGLNVEQWFWTRYNDDEAILPILAYDVDPDVVPVVRVRFQGAQDGIHHILGRMINTEPRPDTFEFDEFTFPDLDDYVFDSGQALPAGFLSDGLNYFAYEGYREDLKGGKAARPGVYLDWIRVAYDRRARARDDYLAFNSGGRQGRWAVAVEGFADPAVILFDVGDSSAVRWVELPGGAVTPSGEGYRLVFADSLAAGETVRWAALAEGGARTFEPGQIVKDEPSSIRTAEADYVVIAHPLFLDGIERLASYRRGQGYRVQVASIADVYDEFNGGIKDPAAIKRYLEWGFERWSVKPQFVLLVGDGSEDHRGLLAESGPDFIPSYPIFAHGEIEATDNWYVRFDDASLLDLYMGRLSVGSTAELDVVIDKILAYEKFSPDDAWRGRVLLVSDDLCSSSEYVSYHCMIPSEEEFERASRVAGDMVRASPGSPMDVQEFHLSEYTGYTLEDGYHESCYRDSSVVFPTSCIQDSVYVNLTPMLFDALNRGVLLFTFQGHGNRKVIFHENIVADSITYNYRWRKDLERTARNGRPYFVHGFGCHFGDFDDPEENSYRKQECILEKMLFIPSGGAIAALGSTGLETISSNSAYQRYLYRAFFEDPPTVTGSDGAVHARWLLGEVQAVSIGYLVAAGYSQSFLNRYVLLGDPALVIDALPPRMTATVDGVPVENGSLIVAGDTSTVHIRVRVGDEVAVDSTSISVGVLDKDGLTPLTAGEDYRVETDTTSTGGRVFVIDYPHEIQFSEYDLVFSARDANGMPVSFSLRVRFTFRAWFDGRLVENGSHVMADAGVVAEVLIPRRVEEGELTVKLAGPAGSHVIPAQIDLMNDNRTQWRILFSLGGLGPGRYALVLGLGSLDQEMITFETGAHLAVESVMAYPNPFDDWTQFSFVLTQPAEVRVRIFTVAGRLIRTIEHGGVVDYQNYVLWDGRDEDGQEVANGTYLYRIGAKAGREVVKSEIGKVVRMK